MINRRSVPPPRWEFCQRRRGQRLRRSVLIGLPCLILAGSCGTLVAVEVADQAVGCGSVDPTDPSNYSEIWIVNDTPQPVLVGECQGLSCSPGLPRPLEPGQRARVDAACGVNGPDMTSYQLTSAGRILGYIAVDTPRKHDGLVFEVSQASTSRIRPTSAS